jgi:site-specific DNA-methyltransferase (adenine-specific)
MPDDFRPHAEYALFARRPISDRIDPATPRDFDGVFRVPRERSKAHLAGKPLALTRDFVEVAPDDGIVLDPFAGSGTTAVAALARGRRFLGCELVDHSHGIATQLLEGLALAT